MKKINLNTASILLMVIVIQFLYSCSNQNKALTSGYIQKRKYTSGYFVRLPGNNSGDKSSDNVIKRKEKKVAVKKRETQNTDSIEVLKPLNDSINEETSMIPENTFYRNENKETNILNKKIEYRKNNTESNYKTNKNVSKNEPIKKDDYKTKNEIKNKKLSAFALMSFILSIAWVLFPISILIAVPTSIVFGIIGLNEIRKKQDKMGKSLAITGIVISLIIVSLFISLVVLLLAAL
ncbi:MAG: DUF4190 domain-containing protein [Bacteroidales bacterium]|nr:DUF4190 domain-containing protein [Bacteroidales bacterium]